MSNGWIGVDLDGTLARYVGWQGAEHIGDPVPLMLERVKSRIDAGLDIRIFTARVSSKNPTRNESIFAIQEWCKKHVGIELPITSEKDYGMIELWDDRCVQVIPNEGVTILDRISYLENKLLSTCNRLCYTCFNSNSSAPAKHSMSCVLCPWNYQNMIL